MHKKGAFKSYKKTIINLIKETFKLPKRGTPKPLWEMFFRYKPENMIIRNFLQNQAKWSDIHICDREKEGEEL